MKYKFMRCQGFILRPDLIGTTKNGPIPDIRGSGRTRLGAEPERRMKISFVSIPNPQFNWGGLGNEFVYFFSLCLCG